MSKSITNAILEGLSSKKRIVEMPEGGDSPMGLLGQVLDVATSQGWSYEDIDWSDEGGYEFFQYSPAGEDFSFTASYGDKSLSDDEKGRNLIKDIESYADDFDEEEHASMWVEFKNSDHPNRDSAPGLKALVQDAEDIHSMLYDLAEELKKINHPMNESYVYNWRDDVEEVEATEENDDIWYSVAENMCEKGENEGYGEDPYEVMSNIISLWKVSKRSRLYKYLLKWYGSEEKLLDNVRDVYDTNNAIYFVTGCGYSIFDADLLGGNADGTTARKFDDFVAKEEGMNEGVLEPRFSGRKSFYGKAGTDETADGNVLTSYQTKIMKIKDGKITMLCGPEALTNTTLRHVREFLQQNGLEPMTKKQLVDLINSQGINESDKKDKEDEKDPNWYCAECGKKKEDYEAMYCDKCWNTKPELRGEGLKENVNTKVKLTEAPSDDISRDEEEYELVDNAPEDIPPEEVDNAEEGEMSDTEYEEEAEDDAKETVKDDIEEPWYATTPELDELRDILPDLDYRLFLINTDMICIGRLNGPDIEFLTANTPNVDDDADVSEANEKAEEVEERAEENEEDSFEYLWIKAPDSFDKFVNQVNVVYLSPELSDEDKEQYAGLEASHESVMNYLMNELPEDKRKEHEKEEPEETPTEAPVEETPAELPASENEIEITVGEEEPTEEEKEEEE